jgi:hypothetical protein
MQKKNLIGEAPETILLDSKLDGGQDSFRALALAGDPELPGIALFHGRNSNPDGPVVGHLRRSLRNAGYTTVSLENPLPSSGDEFADYVDDVGGPNYVFPEANARTKAALREFGRRRLRSAVLLGFSMGSRLFGAFLATREIPFVPIVGFVALGLGVNGPGPLSATTTLCHVSVPMIDICGEGDVDVARSAAARKAAYQKGLGSSYRHVVIPGNVPHNFAGAEAALDRAVLGWLRSLPASG